MVLHVHQIMLQVLHHQQVVHMVLHVHQIMLQVLYHQQVVHMVLHQIVLEVLYH